ncbi:MAG: GIY-YIG nuclease family protein [Sedimentisphaerales bacterium]|jgi:predicted GIY-YIG superfamily endonuclease
MKFYYVYILQSCPFPEHHYIGITEDLYERLKIHNTGKCNHTLKFMPWQIETSVAFKSKEKAFAFERYLKNHSGRAFAKKHF